MLEAGSVLGSDALLPARDLPAWSVADVLPRAVLRPRSVEEIAAIMQEATRSNTAIEPAGGGTWLKHGRRPNTPPVVVSTSRLQQILEYEPADLVISVEAGTPFAKVQDTVARERQMIALDPPAAPAATVGALVSLSEAGPLRLGYGTPRDQVLGMQIVTGDGRIVELGGKVVKNVAGYDLTRLLVGSRGMLGIITQVHLRLRPLPAHDVTFSIDGSTAELCALLPAIQAAAFEPAAMELMAGPIAGTAKLLIRVQGNVAAIDAAALELGRVGGTRTVTQLPDVDAQAAWKAIGDIGLNAVFAARLALLPDQAERLLQLAERLRPFFPRLDIMLHAGSGIVRVYADTTPGDPDRLAHEILQVRGELLTARGSFNARLLPSSLQHKTDAFQPYTAELRIENELKVVFDPASILSRERWAL
jgi:glycolate oxidase FAD binding subunit